MIDGLLDYARIGKINKSKETVDLSVVIPEIVDLVVPKHFEVLIGGNLPVIVTEKQMLEQVFLNLISNAVKYNASKNPWLKISHRDLGALHSFTVADNGIGIEKEYYDKIFIIFQTLKERDAFESTGVGLAIVKKIVEEHKGTVQVVSQFGEGSAFTFTWPKNKN